MEDIMDQLVNSWYDLLNGNLTYDSRQVKVSGVDAANDNSFHHVEIRPESEAFDFNKRSFVTNAVIVLDIVTVHSVAVNKSIVNNIYNQVMQLVFPARPGGHALPALTGLQISTITPQGGSYLEEDDGTKKYYRKVIRFIHRINQTS